MTNMTRQIWKFPIYESDIEIKMPKGAEILCVQAQNSTACIWAIVDPNQANELRYFEFFGTGHNIYDIAVSRKYIGSFQLNKGSLVLHLFERIK